jgi:Mce-associated membrane protein
VLAVLVAVLAATLVRVRADLGEARAAADDREAALRAAGAHAVSLLSVDYRTVDQDMRRILATSTAQARDGYIKNAAPLKRTTIGSRVIQEGALRSAGLVSMSAARDSAEVLVVADGVIRWAGGKAAPQERYYRWDMRLTKIGNSWLVAKAEQVS